MKYWQINAIEVKPQEGELTDVVYIIHWSRIANEVVNDKEYVASLIGTYTCPAPTGDFTPYEELTEEQVCGWLDAGLNWEGMDKSLDNQISIQVNPPIVQMPLPWATTAPEQPTEPELEG